MPINSTDEMSTFFEIQKLPKFTQEEIGKFIRIKEIEFIA
jgi:hypothetical protein